MIQPLFDRRVKPDGSRHANVLSEYVYALYLTRWAEAFLSRSRTGGLSSKWTENRVEPRRYGIFWHFFKLLTYCRSSSAQTVSRRRDVVLHRNRLRGA